MVTDFFQKEPLSDVNPDEVVAKGAAIQAGVVTGTLQEVLLLDVTPLSLGIELADDVFSVLIPRNSNIPTSATKKFTTVVDNQRNVFVHVLQGERKRASLNRSLTNFRLTNITPAPKELPEIEVLFNIDANGILNVTASDLTSGISKEIKIESFRALKSEDYDRKIEEAEIAKEEDITYVQNIKKVRRARQTQEVFKNFLKGEEANIKPDDIGSIQEFINCLDEAIDKNEFEALDNWVRALESVSEKYADIFSNYEDVD